MTDRRGAETPSYVTRRRPMSAEIRFEARRDRLAWQEGSGPERSLAYADVATIRLRYDTSRMMAQRFLMDVVPVKGAGRPITISSASPAGLVGWKHHGEAYRAFVRALHERVARANPRVAFVAGRHPIVYWLFVVVGLLMISAMLAAAITSALGGQWLIVLAGLGLAAYGGMLTLNVARANAPGYYDPLAIPERLLPRAEPDLKPA